MERRCYGISLLLLVLTAVLVPISIAASKSVQKNQKMYMIAMLLLETGMLGVFIALDMILFSKRIDAREALSIGLINQVSTKDRLMDDAMSFAEVLAKRPPLAVGEVLHEVLHGNESIHDRDPPAHPKSRRRLVGGFT